MEDRQTLHANANAATDAVQKPKPAGRTTAATAPISAPTLTRNLSLCVVGLVLGFAFGFFLANRLSVEPRGAASAVAATTGGPKAAPPLDPTQTDGTLPPNHPQVNGANNSAAANPNGVAATSAQAQAAMEEADRKPKDFDAQMNAAAIFYQSDAFAQATLYLQRALIIKPRDPDALTALGNIKYDANDFNGAADFYARALAADPKNADVQTDLGNTYFRRTPPDFARAITEYRKALTVDPKHEKALQNIAAAALKINDKAAARTAVEQLASINPANPRLKDLRASIEAAP